MNKIFIKQYNCHDCNKIITEELMRILELKKNQKVVTKLILCLECKSKRLKNV